PISAWWSRTSGVFRPLTEGSRSIRTGLYVATLEVPRDARPIVAAAGSGYFRPLLRQRGAPRTGARAGAGAGARARGPPRPAARSKRTHQKPEAPTPQPQPKQTNPAPPPPPATPPAQPVAPPPAPPPPSPAPQSHLTYPPVYRAPVQPTLQESKKPSSAKKHTSRPRPTPKKQ